MEQREVKRYLADLPIGREMVVLASDFDAERQRRVEAEVNSVRREREAFVLGWQRDFGTLAEAEAEAARQYKEEP